METISTLIELNRLSIGWKKSYLFQMFPTHNKKDWRIKEAGTKIDSIQYTTNQTNMRNCMREMEETIFDD